MTFNPWALVISLVGIALIVIGFRGNQDNIIAAATGRAYKKSTLR